MIVGIITDPGIGGTFLTWSLHYLTGDTKIFHTATNNWVDISHNPLTEINAHNCTINHPLMLDEFNDCILQLTTTPPTSFHSVYIHQLHNYQFETKRIESNVQNDKATLAAIDTIQKISKLIVVELLPSQALYLSKFEGRALANKLSNPSEHHVSFEDQHADFIDTFFHQDKLAWESLTDIWNYREFLSLNLRLYMTTSVISSVDLTKEHFYINCFDLFNNFDKLLEPLFSFLSLTIDPKRKDQWVSIYRQWQKLHYDRVLFVEYFDQIITSIINNHYMDLTRFNLDIIREAIIQHVLIYKYGLTLKSWGLEKFPDNTQDLHELLEPNIYHQVEDIYNVLK